VLSNGTLASAQQQHCLLCTLGVEKHTLVCCSADTVHSCLLLRNWALACSVVQRVLEETGEKLRDTTATLAAATKPKDVTIRALMQDAKRLVHVYVHASFHPKVALDDGQLLACYRCC
jgi:hypothetical protein